MTDKTNASTPIRNPFTPEFGKVPAYMAGRSMLISDMVQALEGEGSDPNLCTVFIGARGTGKTAMLSFLSDEAQRLGWVSANVTAVPGMLEDVLQRLRESAAHLLQPNRGRNLTGVELGGFLGLSWERSHDDGLNWRSRMNLAFDELGETGTGVLITVDEVDPSLDEMVELVTTYQHFVREGKRVALLMAGLPHNVSALLSGKTTSFLRRASRQTLGSLPDYEVEEAFRLTVEDGGRMIDREAIDRAVESIGGFPFMFQLVGYRAWNATRGDVVGAGAVEEGARLAQAELEDRIFEATFRELSNNDRRFLFAMLDSEGPSTRGELMERLGKGTSHISTYKRRLQESGVIEEQGIDAFDFALPGFRDYLRSKRIENMTIKEARRARLGLRGEVGT